MRCPKCKSYQSNCIDSRLVKNEVTRRRRYECVDCKCRWSTIEILKDDFDKLKALSTDLKNLSNYLNSIF